MATISPEAIAQLLGISATEVDQLFKKDGEEVTESEAGAIILERVNAKITSLVEGAKSSFDSKGIRDRARRELQQEFNAALSEKGATGENWKDQLEDLVAKLSESKPQDITDADIANHPYFKTSIQGLKDQISTLEDDKVSIVKEYSEKQRKEAIRAKAIGYVANPANKYVIPDSQAKAQKTLDNYVRDLTSSEIRLDLDADGKLIVVDASGNPAQDSSFNPINPDDFMSNVGELYYDKSVSAPRSTPPVNGNGGTPNGGMPALDTDLDLDRHIEQMRKDGKSIEERKAVIKHFEETQAARQN